MRPLPQGASAARRGVVPRGAGAHHGTGPRRGAAGTSHLTVAPTRAPCVGVLLAGGAARRFGGRPKGLASVQGVRVADLALSALAGAADETIVVANDPRAAGWFPTHTVVADAEPGLGPLGGLATALASSGGRAVLVVAWDMPFVTAALLRALRAMGEGTGAGAVVPTHPPGDTPEPLCAYYAPHALGACRALLAAGERRATALREVLPDARTLSGAALRAIGDPARLFTSVDTPAGLLAIGGSFDDPGV